MCLAALRPSRLVLVSLAASILLAPGCSEETAPGTDDSSVAPVGEEDPREAGGRFYERALVFTTLGRPTPGSPEDTTTAVPLFFTAVSTDTGVSREIRGWVHRAGSWEPFADERWTAGPSRTPWRVVPRGPVRLVVGFGGALETVVFEDPPRILELDLGGELAAWTGSRGGTYRIESTSLILGTRRFDGITLDLTRAWDLAATGGGDWGLLVSGDSLQLVLESPEASAPGAPGAFQAFVRVDFRQLQWPDVTLDWTDSRAYEPARRDVPAGWRLTSSDRELSGELRAESSLLDAGQGEGPVLPVRALFTVRGTVRLEGNVYPVHGVVRHARE